MRATQNRRTYQRLLQLEGLGWLLNFSVDLSHGLLRNFWFSLARAFPYITLLVRHALVSVYREYRLLLKV